MKRTTDLNNILGVVALYVLLFVTAAAEQCAVKISPSAFDDVFCMFGSSQRYLLIILADIIAIIGCYFLMVSYGINITLMVILGIEIIAYLFLFSKWMTVYALFILFEKGFYSALMVCCLGRFVLSAKWPRAIILVPAFCMFDIGKLIINLCLNTPKGTSFIQGNGFILFLILLIISSIFAILYSPVQGDYNKEKESGPFPYKPVSIIIITLVCLSIAGAAGNNEVRGDIEIAKIKGIIPGDCWYTSETMVVFGTFIFQIFLGIIAMYVNAASISFYILLVALPLIAIAFKYDKAILCLCIAAFSLVPTSFGIVLYHGADDYYSGSCIHAITALSTTKLINDIISLISLNSVVVMGTDTIIFIMMTIIGMIGVMFVWKYVDQASNIEPNEENVVLV